jgi:hypothetical protein
MDPGLCQLKKSLQYSFLLQVQTHRIEQLKSALIDLVRLFLSKDCYKLTISKANPLISTFHEVISALLLLYKSNCILPTLTTPIASQVTNNYRFSPYFNDCLGALDGTHIEMLIPSELQPRYRNRKGTLSQNVLAVCNFNMEFVYILAGWEGSAHDVRVLQDAQFAHGFKTPKQKYWLGDAGYANSEFVLSPYRGVRYHLKEVRQAHQRPSNAKELFNLRHSSLRNVVERIFGVLKRQWQILAGKGCEYSIDTQSDLFCALIGLFNFGRQHGEVALFLEDAIEDLSELEDIQEPNKSTTAGSAWMDQKREQIAIQMWEDYLLFNKRKEDLLEL